MQIVDLFLVLIAAAVAGWLLSPRMRNRPLWQAIVTPLASIIGSGFLIIAPLLGYLVGDYAFVAMLALVLAAYGLGAAIRYNIRYEAPYLHRHPTVTRLEWLAGAALVLAYVTSVAFYLRLLAAFVFNAGGVRHPLGEKVLTSALLLFIGWTGKQRGLSRLEHLEKYSVSLKLAVIAALLAGLLYHDARFGLTLDWTPPQMTFLRWRQLAGFLLVVQGFETSKYLTEAYDAETLVRSMRWAQWLSGGIYLLFVFLVTPLLRFLPAGQADETAIIALSRHVASVLPGMLVLGALMSQFSAGVADTVGAGELLAYITRQRIPSRWGFFLITLAALALIWSANVFEIVTYASRAFAFYYLLQVLIAWVLARERRQWAWLGAFTALAALAAFVTFLAVPVAA